MRESSLEWVVLRPSLMFGDRRRLLQPRQDDAALVVAGRSSPSRATGRRRFQPLSVDDLAIAVEKSLTDADRAGSVYELGGPEWLTYRQIVDEVMRVTGMRRLKLGMPIPLISALTAVTDRVLPIFPVSHDQISSLQRPNYTDLDAFERAFGVTPRQLDLSYLGNPPARR